jgi:hypothetical protein
MFLLFMFRIIQSHSRTMVYTNAFVVDLSSMQSIKQLTNDLLVYGLYMLSILVVRGSIDGFLSKGCTRAGSQILQSPCSVFPLLSPSMDTWPAGPPPQPRGGCMALTSMSYFFGILKFTSNNARALQQEEL